MAGDRSGWRFYGRKKELSQVNRWMMRPDFRAMAVIGGRGVGKTELIGEAAKTLGNRKPYIYVELPRIVEGISDAERLGAIREVCNGLTSQARAQGLAEALPEPGMPDDYGGHMMYFREALENLLKCGTVIALDEFQNAMDLSLVNGVKLTIDGFYVGRIPQAAGKLILAGSHQQKILKMLHDPDAPLYQRVNPELLLRPLPALALFEMAADLGWLSRPARFLTAYAAFGGIPRLWRGLAEDQADGSLPEPPGGSDDGWRRSFLMHRIRRILSGSSERFFDTAYVNLSGEARTVAGRLAEHPSGVRWTAVTGLFRDKPDEATGKARRGFYILREHLGIAESMPLMPRSGPRDPKIRLTDQAALFELAVMPHWLNEFGELPGNPPEKALDIMSASEGFALERLTREWLEAHANLDSAERSVEVRLDDGRQLEIDVVGETLEPRPGGRRWLILCSCKRNHRNHVPQKTAQEFDDYIGERETPGDGWRPEDIRRILVSPEWPEDSRPDDGFIRAGLQGMALKFGFEPRPWPVPAAGVSAPEPAPAREAGPEDGSPDLGM